MAALPHVGFANVFGQTETLGAYTTLTPDDHLAPERIGSVGRALPGVEVRVVDPGHRQPTCPTARSASCGCAPTRTCATTGSTPATSPGSTPTATSTRAGRLTDTINRGGEKFGPIEIEAVLREHPAVARRRRRRRARPRDGRAGRRCDRGARRAHGGRRPGVLLGAPRDLQDTGDRRVRRRPAVQRHRQGRPPSSWSRSSSVLSSRTRRCHAFATTKPVGESGACCSCTRCTRSWAPRRTSSRPRTARVDADAGGGRRRPAPLVHEPRARQRRRRTTWSPSPACATVPRGSAWHARLQQGDLRDWAREVDGLRHDVHAKTLLPGVLVADPGSRLRRRADRRPRARPVAVHGGHRLAVSSLDDYIQCWDELYRQPLLSYATDMQAIPIDIQACFQVAHGSHLRREAMLWQRSATPRRCCT